MAKIKNLNQFLDNNDVYNEWLKEGNIRIYVRKNMRYFPNNSKLLDCLDISNVEVKSAHRGKGEFTKFLKRIEKDKRVNIIFVENILDKRFRDFFIKRQYKVHPSHICDHNLCSVYKYVKE